MQKLVYIKSSWIFSGDGISNVPGHVQCSLYTLLDTLCIQLRCVIELYTRLYLLQKNRIYVSCIHVVDILQQFVSNFPFSSFSTRTSFSVVAPNRTSQCNNLSVFFYVEKDNVKILRIYQGFSTPKKIVFFSVKILLSFVL